MKKFLFGIFAMTFALVLASFTTTSNASKAKVTGDYYWIATDESGAALDPEYRLDGDEPADVEDAFGDCDEGNKFCAKAYVTLNDQRHTPFDITKE